MTEPIANWAEAFKAEMTEYLTKNHIEDLAEIFEVEDTTYDIGFCDTCSWEVAAIEVIYKDTAGRARTKTVELGFAELMKRLTGGWS